MIAIGQKVRFKPLEGVYFIGCTKETEPVIGEVVYINEPHRWFSVMYGYGNNCRTSFLFCDIGEKIHML